MIWNIELIGVNVVQFYTVGRRDVVRLEYDFDSNTLNKFSALNICRHFVQGDRLYCRDKPGNSMRYARLLSSLPLREACRMFA